MAQEPHPLNTRITDMYGDELVIMVSTQEPGGAVLRPQMDDPEEEGLVFSRARLVELRDALTAIIDQGEEAAG